MARRPQLLVKPTEVASVDSDTESTTDSPSEQWSFSNDDLEFLSKLRGIYHESYDECIYNDLPQYLVRVSGQDITLFSREELREELRPRFEGITLDLEGEKGIQRRFSDKALRSHCKNRIKQLLKYAIFSHRWGEREPTFGDISNKIHGRKSPPEGPGYEKLLRFCEKAKEYGCDYVWSDTCCINKESSAELEEAIRSMFRWYRDAYICIVHLAKSSSVEDFPQEPWFTRGWTLQELLAARRLRIFGKQWTAVCPREEEATGDTGEEQFPFLNDKRSNFMTVAISEVTGIDIESIWDFHSTGKRVSVSEKMRWASKRRTTRIEDTAYSLLGIFDITMPVAYGEGERAFRRLLEAIAQSSLDSSLFAWGGDYSQFSKSLPASPASYENCFPGPRGGDLEYTIGKLGVQLKLLVIPVIAVRNEGEAGYTLRPADAILARDMTIIYQLPYIPPSDASDLALGVVNFTPRQQSGYVQAGRRYFCIFMADVSHLAHSVGIGVSAFVGQRLKTEGVLPMIEGSINYEAQPRDVCLLQDNLWWEGMFSRNQSVVLRWFPLLSPSRSNRVHVGI